jgi:hypothetical protein
MRHTDTDPTAIKAACETTLTHTHTHTYYADTQQVEAVKQALQEKEGIQVDQIRCVWAFVLCVLAYGMWV